MRAVIGGPGRGIPSGEISRLATRRLKSWNPDQSRPLSGNVWRHVPWPSKPKDSARPGVFGFLQVDGSQLPTCKLPLVAGVETYGPDAGLPGDSASTARSLTPGWYATWMRLEQANRTSSVPGIGHTTS